MENDKKILFRGLIYRKIVQLKYRLKHYFKKKILLVYVNKLFLFEVKKTFYKTLIVIFILLVHVSRIKNLLLYYYHFP